ncbi:MAG: hypothetical protein NTZ03_00325 [Actinobacteria bacterium]|nr:hypothetical protein [Actinomycetota bacterium]
MAEPSRGRRRDFWQLHVPLVLVLLLCTVLTVVEVRRAGEGVWRAWIYMVEWPLIAVVSIWIWHRYRTEGSITKGLVERWKARVEEYSAAASDEPVSEAAPPDPQLQAWEDYVQDLNRRQPPGGPSGGGA